MKKIFMSFFAATALCCLVPGSGHAQLARNPASRLPANFLSIKQQEYNNKQTQEVSFQQFYDVEVTRFYHEDALRLNSQLAYRPGPGGVIGVNPSMCGNGDFEAGISTTEWQGGYGFVDNVGNIQYSSFANGITGGPINDGSAHQTLVNSGTDPNVPINMTAPTGSTHAVRLGNAVNGNGAELLSKTFIVPSGNSIVGFWYALVLQDPGHNQNEQPAFRINVLDASGNPVSGVVDLGNGSNIAVSDANNPFFLSYGSGGNLIAYRDWSCASINLSQFVGQQVTVQFVTNDCSLGGHYGYAYIDDFCGSCSSNPYNVALGATTCDEDKSSICLNYQLPTQGGLTGSVNIDLNIYQNGNLITTLNSGTISGGSSYCFSFSPSAVSGLDPSLGGFDYTAVGHFSIGSVTLSPFYLFSPPDGSVPGLNNDCVLRKHCCPGDNLIRNGDFESGNTDFYSEFTYQPAISANSVWVGEYSVLNDAEALTVASTWNTDCPASGHHLVVNGATGQSTGYRKAWEQGIAVDPGTTYKFCGEFKLLPPCAFPAKGTRIIITVTDGNWTESSLRKIIPATTGTCNWTAVDYTFTVPDGVTSIKMNITMTESITGDGNDLAMDNFNLVALKAVPLAETDFTVTPYDFTRTTYNVNATGLADLGKECTNYWEVAEVDPNAGYAVIGGTEVIDPVAWRPLLSNTFIGYVGTNVLSGSGPGVFSVHKTYRFVYGRTCACEGITKQFIILGPWGNPASKQASGEGNTAVPQVLGKGVLHEETDSRSPMRVGKKPVQSMFLIFPNPTNSKVTIQKSLTDGDYEVKAFNAFGQLVSTVQMKADDAKVEMSLAAFPAGNYMLQVVSAKGTIVYSEKVTRL